MFIEINHCNWISSNPVNIIIGYFDPNESTSSLAVVTSDEVITSEMKNIILQLGFDLENPVCYDEYEDQNLDKPLKLKYFTTFIPARLVLYR